MIKLELLVLEDQADIAKTALREIGIRKILLFPVKEYDEEHSHVEGYRGTQYVVDFVNKTKMEIVVDSEEMIDRALHILSVEDIETEVFVYPIMKHHLVTKRVS